MITYTADDGELRIIDREWLNPTDQAILLKGQSRRTAGKLRRSFAALEQQETAWNAAATPAQHQITWGCWYRQDFTGNALLNGAVIYGRVLPLFEIIEAEEAAGAGTAEIDQLVARIREGYVRGWRHVRGHSIAEPHGETGETHVACMTAITGAEFEAAQLAGWPA